jgi:hypothetical protein
MPDRLWHPPISESHDVVFQEKNPASERNLIGQRRRESYIQSISEGYEYVGWLDDDDFTNPYYFTKALQILEDNPNMDGIASLQATYFDDVIDNHCPKTSGNIVPASHLNYHGPCVYRSSSLIKGLDVLENFVGYDENRVLAKNMISMGFNLYLWESYETFLVRNYDASRKRIESLIAQRYE